MSDGPATPLLDSVHFPADIRKLDKAQLRQLADELREETISAVSVTGGVRQAAKSAGFSAPRPVIEVRGTCGDCDK